jgi:type II secretory pathway component PulF
MLLSKRLPLAGLIQLCRVLRHNLSAGLMLRDIFRQQAKRGLPVVRPVADRIWQSLEEGDSLEIALGREKDSFPPLFLELSSVGEHTGNMPEIFGELERYYLMQQKFWRQFVSQSFLPMIQFVAATFIIAGLMFLLGFIAEITNSKPLDPLGLGLTGGGGALIFLASVYGIVAALLLAYLAASRSLQQKAIVDRFLMRLPGAGPFFEAISLARFAMALRLTMDSAMPIATALGLSLRATGNAAFASCVDLVQDALRSGDDLTVALTRCRVFPAEFLNLVAMAEEGGRVPEVMANQAKYYEEEAERRLAVLTRLASFGVWLFVACLIILAIFKIFGLYMSAINNALRAS